MLKQCEVSELEEIARQEGIEIPARIYADKEHLAIHLRWYVNVKGWYVEVGAEEEEYVTGLDKDESTLVDVCAGVENYECGKLTEEELSEVLESATAETLREYILEVIASKGKIPCKVEDESDASLANPADIGSLKQAEAEYQEALMHYEDGEASVRYFMERYDFNHTEVMRLRRKWRESGYGEKERDAYRAHRRESLRQTLGFYRAVKYRDELGEILTEKKAAYEALKAR